jgi:tetratricopeptide (TPR) repeat protein
MRCARAVCSVAGVALVIATARVDADPAAAAAAFTRGQKLYDQGKFDEACAAFEDSLQEDFAYGALYNLADCDVKRGHLAAALHEYERLAAEDPKPDRRAASADLAKKLATRVPKIVVSADARPGLVVLLDDKDITSQIGTEIAVELGDHVVRAQLPGQPERRIEAPAKTEGALVRIDVAVQTEIAKPLPPPPPPENRYRTLSGGLVIGGGAVLASGLVAGGVAWWRWHDAQAAAKLGDRHELARTDSARSWGTASTILCIAGLATAAGGVVLWRYGRTETTVHAAASASSAALVVAGSF